MTFTEIVQRICKQCNLTSADAVERVGESVNQHHRRITSELGLDVTRFVTRQAATTIGARTVTFAEIEKINSILDVTDTSAVRPLTEVSIHRQRTTQPHGGQPRTWAPQNATARGVTVLLDTTSADDSFTLQADGWTTLSDLSGSDEPVFAESFHDILTYYVMAEELLKKEKIQLAREYATGDEDRPGRAEKLLSKLRFHYADSPTRDLRQANSGIVSALAGGGGGGSSIDSTLFVKGGINVGDYATLAAALSAISTDQRTLVIHESTQVTSSTTIPTTCSVLFMGEGMFDIASGQTLTINGPMFGHDGRRFTGDGAVVLPNAGDIHIRWFGGKGDDSTDNSTPWQKAITCAQASRVANVLFGPGIFRYGTKITTTTAGNGGLTFIGTRDAAHEQGSQYPATLLRWTGGASETVLVSETFCTFRDFAIENVGTATHLIKVDTSGAGRVRLERISGQMSGGAVVYSTAIVETPHTNYDVYIDCEFGGCSPEIVRIDANGAGTGTTTVRMEHCIIDCNSATASGMKVFNIVDGTVELLDIRGNTFNNQAGGGGLCVVDCTDIGSGTMLVLNYEANEYDGDASQPAESRALKLKNVNNARVKANTFLGGGVMTAMIDLTNSTLHIGVNRASSVAGPIVDTQDSASQVFPSHCNVNAGNVSGGLVNSDTAAGIVTITPVGTAAVLYGQYGDPGGHTNFLLTATGSTAHTFTYAVPTDGTPGYMTRGQIVTVTLKNDSGGAMGTTTWDSGHFELLSPWSNPASGETASLTCVFTGSKLREVGRSVPALASGAYTPTLTNSSNVAASTAYDCHYLRLGSTVAVSGKVDIDPTSATTLTVLGISLPVASNFANEQDCSGTAACAAVQGYAAAIVANGTNNRADLAFTTGSDVANRTWAFTFDYRVA